MNSGTNPETKSINHNPRLLIITVAAAIILLLITAASIALNSYGKALRAPDPKALSTQQQELLANRKELSFGRSLLNPLPYGIIPAELDINARSAIVIDVANGCVLYEKNADEVIPPASMTKLVVMYVVEQEINTGRISYLDQVPLPPESWAVNQPEGSSLMFLAEGQIVTLDELLQGLAVCSGNDAAYALAYYVSGSIEAFVERMNQEVKALGLTQTHFVEPSGYSEYNVTTAREFAAFARRYLFYYPESIANYHSLRTFEYPMPWNLPENFSSLSVPADVRRFYPDTPISWNNTNKTLDAIPGADGLKTGYIDESGYNLAYTVQRGDTRFLSITLGGPGKGSVQGNKYRLEDAQTITDFGYRTFTTVMPEEMADIPLPVAGGRENAVFLTPAWHEAITVPHLNGAGITDDGESDSVKLEQKVMVPAYIDAPVAAGTEYGKIVYSLKGTILSEVPLIADRDIEAAWNLKGSIDRFLLN